MSPGFDRRVLEDLWRERLSDARLRLDFARNYLGEVGHDPLGDSPAPDGHFAFQRAIKAERFALPEYIRILRLFSDLVMNGIVPDEDAFRRAQATNEDKAE